MSESLRRFRAWLTGKFWMPCPRCGRMFGGHEIKGSIMTEKGPGYSRGLGTCCPPDEMEEGRVR